MKQALRRRYGSPVRMLSRCTNGHRGALIRSPPYDPPTSQIAGWMFQEQAIASDKVLYTTGRLTSEMVIKCALMGIPVLASRSGFTAWGVEIARQVGLTLIGRMRGQRFVCLSGEDRLQRDVDPNSVPEEARKHGRKSGAKT